MLWRVVLISSLGLFAPGSLTGDDSKTSPPFSSAVVEYGRVPHSAFREVEGPDGALPGVEGIVGPLGPPPSARPDASVVKPDRHNRAAG